MTVTIAPAWAGERSARESIKRQAGERLHDPGVDEISDDATPDHRWAG